MNDKNAFVTNTLYFCGKLSKLIAISLITTSTASTTRLHGTILVKLKHTIHYRLKMASHLSLELQVSLEEEVGTQQLNY